MKLKIKAQSATVVKSQQSTPKNSAPKFIIQPALKLPLRELVGFIDMNFYTHS